MTECPRFGKIFHGCRFVGRYDEKPRVLGSLKTSNMEVHDLRNLITLNVYVRDVCIRCGQTIERVDGMEQQAT